MTESVFTARYELNIFTQATLLSFLTGLVSRVTTRSSTCLTGKLRNVCTSLYDPHSNTALPRMRKLLYSSNKVKFPSLSACSDGKRKPNLHKFRMGGEGGFLKSY